MNGLALFSGVGGLELGLRLALGPRYRAVCHVERDAYAAATLVARMADETLDPAPIWDDVSTFDGKPWRGVVDLVSGGFPCQDISIAGKGTGLAGARSGLWSEYARIVREVGPRYVFVENVPALVNRGIGRVLGDLAALGFDAEWDVFSAAGVGAPHLRRRIFILAHRQLVAHPGRLCSHRRESGGCEARGSAAPDAGGTRPTMADGDGDGREGFEPPGSTARPARRCAAPMGDADGGRCEGERQPQRPWERRARWDAPDGHDPHGRFAWPPGPGDAAGWREWIEAGGPEPAIRRGADGNAARLDRLRCLGNGVVPLVAARAWVELAGRLSRD